ncbi:MAG: S49 family peptidase [Deltaproteobacteria bacterium]|nr:S49 family peptidase [Deltaproteobacteria bacterium]
MTPLPRRIPPFVRAALVALVAWTAQSPAAAGPADPTPRPLVVPWSIPIELEGAESLLSHAAGLGFLQGYELAALMTTRLDGRATVAGGGAVLAARLGPIALGFGVGGVGDGPSTDTTTSRYDFGLALRLSDRLSVGWQWTSLANDDLPAVDRYTASSLSLTARLTRGFGATLALDRLDAPTGADGLTEEPPVLRFGVGVRPATDRVTLAVEGARTLPDDDDDAYWQVTGSARAMIIPGLVLGAYGRFGFAESGPAPAATEVGVMLGVQQSGLAVETGFDWGSVDGASQDETRLSVLVRARSGRHAPLVPRGGQVVRLTLRGELPERPSAPLFGGTAIGFAHVLVALDALRRDDRVDGLLLQIDQAPSWAQCWELRRALAAVRAAGKKILALVTVADNRVMYLAAAADEVHLYAAGGLMIFGLAITQSYYLGLLDKLGVKAELIAYEEYKSAPELFTRTGPTDPAREQTRALLDGLDAEWIAAVSAGRKKSPDDVRSMRETAPHSMHQAVALGLVDGLVESDAVGKLVERVFGAGARLVDDYDPPVSAFAPWGGKRVVAILPVTGSIVEGGSDGPMPLPIPFLGGETTGDQSFVRALEGATRDPSVVGIVVRVDSGGGSAIASDRMHRAIMIAAKSKPLVVSFGDVAASGGYYLAAGAPEILATPVTITGSIGIFSGKADLSGFYALLGITTNTEKTSPRADMLEPYRPFTDAERDAAKLALRAYYERFVDLVAEGRKLPKPDAYAVAKGRVWLGTHALDKKLVDRHAGLLDAIVAVRERAGYGPDDPVGLRYLGGLGPFSSLQRLVGQVFGLDEVAAAAPRLPAELARLAGMVTALGHGGPLAMMPYTLRIGP